MKTLLETKSVIRIIFSFVLAISFIFTACSNTEKNDKTNTTKKVGVLLVNHGSHSPTWREALVKLEDSVRTRVLSNSKIDGIKTAFMEYTEPSIATQLKEFDSENYTDIILVPIFLTVSSHSFDDIPTIAGLKEDKHSIELLKIENIERYKPKAKVHITPLLDFENILQKNVERRVKQLTKNVNNEGLVLIAYGDKGYNKEWSALLDKVGNHVKETVGINEYSYGWCGHVAHYSSDSTTIAINKVLEKKEKAIVIPILVAHDEMFQIKIIGGGIKNVKNSKQKVIYKPDSILPDKNVEKWVISITSKYVKKIFNKKQ